jgi:hypothetical protein
MDSVHTAFKQVVSAHRAYGDIVGDAEASTSDGYRLWHRQQLPDRRISGESLARW